MKTIMTIGAHVGDMELTAGGLVASEAAKGNRTVLVSMTAGEKGNPPGMGVDEYRRQKVEEAEAFASAFSGVSIVLDGADGLLKEDDENVWTLVDLIRQYSTGGTAYTRTMPRPAESRSTRGTTPETRDSRDGFPRMPAPG